MIFSMIRMFLRVVSNYFLGIILVIAFSSTSSAQIVTTIAGIQDNIGSKNDVPLNSTFNNPHGVEIDRNGIIYVADRYNHLIRKVDLNGVVTTLAGSGQPGSDDGQGTAASFKEPWG